MSIVSSSAFNRTPSASDSDTETDTDYESVLVAYAVDTRSVRARFPDCAISREGQIDPDRIISNIIQLTVLSIRSSALTLSCSA